jgi:hypothetical protein
VEGPRSLIRGASPPVAHLVEALRYKAEGHGFDSQHNPSGHTMAVGSTQRRTEMSTRNVSWGE